jgi:hypothetical protein
MGACGHRRLAFARDTHHTLTWSIVKANFFISISRLFYGSKILEGSISIPKWVRGLTKFVETQLMPVTVAQSRKAALTGRP